MELMELMKDLHPLGVQSAWTEYAFNSMYDGALDFKQRIGASDSPFGVLVEVQAARKLAATYTLTQAA